MGWHWDMVAAFRLAGFDDLMTIPLLMRFGTWEGGYTWFLRCVMLWSRYYLYLAYYKRVLFDEIFPTS